MRTTKGIVIAGKNQIEVRNDCPLPDKVNPTGAIIKPEIWSVCTSDAHLCATGCATHPYLIGRATGHEMCGVVEEVGEEVKDFKPGDRVVVCTKMPNWRSYEAQDGYYRGNTDNMFWGDPGPDRGGMFVEHFYMRDADMNLAHMPDNVTMEQAVMIPDMMGTGFQGAEELGIRLGDTIVVFGVGPVGLMALAAAVLKGAGRVIAIDSREDRFAVAREFGATATVDYHEENYIQKIIAMNGGRPVDGVIMAGGRSSELNKAMQLVKRGGTILNLTKYMDEEILYLDMKPWSYGTGGKNIRSVSAAGGRAFLQRMLNLIECGRVQPEKIVTHRFHGIDQIPQAFQLYMDQDPTLIKAVIYSE